jgi:hypothetical protein
MQSVQVEKAVWVAVIAALCILVLRGVAKLVPADKFDRATERVKVLGGIWQCE